MVEQAKQSQEQADQQQTPDKTAGSSGGFMKYLLYGGVAIVVAVVVAIGVAFVFNGKSVEQAESANENSAIEAPARPGQNHETTEPTEANIQTEPSPDDLGLSEEDASAVDKIMDNLAFLDYEPNDSELMKEEGEISVEDSIEQISWIEKEKQVLAARAKELDVRQKELERLEQQVNKKLLNVEQVESSRTASLAKLYDGMDARSVAQLLANLDDKTVVSILPRMKVKNASAVLQLMPPQRAAKLSKQMISLADN
ncbi:MAG: hypothetical protein AB1483_09380 [Candidatus Zixiibacteriota bacterium]